MSDASDTRRRALLAVFIGAVGAFLGIAGVGHAYLREWRRGFAWFVFVLGAGLLLIATFADPETAAFDTLPTEVYVPLGILLLVSLADTYWTAMRSGPAGENGDESASCPHCGHEVEAGIEFCWYCAEPLDATGATDDATSR